MRPDEAKSDFSYDPLNDEWCILYPDDWLFHQTKMSYCRVDLTMDFSGRMEAVERLSNFSNACKANKDRLKSLWLKTAGLQLTTYELKECFDIGIEPVDFDEGYKISFRCFQYDQYIKVNKDVRYQTFEPFNLGLKK